MTAGSDAVPAGEGNASFAPGRRGAPPAGNKTRCQELADGMGLSRPYRKRGPRRKTPRWSARRRRALSPKGPRALARRARVSPIARAAHKGLRQPLAPPGAPSPRGEGKREAGSPRALQTNGAAERWLGLFDNRCRAHRQTDRVIQCLRTRAQRLVTAPPSTTPRSRRCSK